MIAKSKLLTGVGVLILSAAVVSAANAYRIPHLPPEDQPPAASPAPTPPAPTPAPQPEPAPAPAPPPDSTNLDLGNPEGSSQDIPVPTDLPGSDSTPSPPAPEPQPAPTPPAPTPAPQPQPTPAAPAAPPTPATTPPDPTTPATTTPAPAPPVTTTQPSAPPVVTNPAPQTPPPAATAPSVPPPSPGSDTTTVKPPMATPPPATLEPPIIVIPAPPPPPPIFDTCRNLDGIQDAVPTYYVRDDEGVCSTNPELDLSVGVSPSTLTGTIGSMVSWTDTITNTSTVEYASSVLLKDELHDGLGPTRPGEPINVQISTSHGSCHYDPGQAEVICDIGTLQPQEAETVKVTVTARGAGYHVAKLDCEQRDTVWQNDTARQDLAIR